MEYNAVVCFTVTSLPSLSLFDLCLGEGNFIWGAMVKKIKTTVLKCKNYEAHLAVIEKHPDRQNASLWIRSNMDIAYGWRKVDGEWLCSACVEQLEK